MMDEKQMREAAAKIEAGWQMGGLTGGLYEDFAVEVAKLAVAAERERCAKLCEQYAWLQEEGSSARSNFRNCATTIRTGA